MCRCLFVCVTFLSFHIYLLFLHIHHILTETSEIKRNGHSWMILRKEILAKFDYKCQKCGKRYPNIDVPYRDRKLEVHHIIPLLNGGTHELSNLLVLCIDCHREEEKKDKRNFNHSHIRKTKNQKMEKFL